MKVLSIIAVSAAMAASFVSAQQTFKEVVVFGDSYSDSGNTFKQSNGKFPPSPPYAAGRFSNGPVWVENVASKFNAPIRNFAYGGAVANSSAFPAGDEVRSIPDFYQQLDSFGKNNTGLDLDQTLFLVFIGGNDYLGALPQVLTQALLTQKADVGSTITAISNSVLAGINTLVTTYKAKHILTLTLPPIQAAPASSQLVKLVPAAFLNVVNTIASNHNTALKQGLDNISKQNPVKIYYANTYDPLVDITSSTSSTLRTKYNIQNSNSSCLSSKSLQSATFKLSDALAAPFLDRLPSLNARQSSAKVCDQPDTYLFWDGLHPTATGHKVLGDVALETLAAAAAAGGSPAAGSSGTKPGSAANVRAGWMMLGAAVGVAVLFA
ncbi:hypothetical protein HDU97_009109 [Phlyctochytrium planicorne]|nr:hypothetical protein HDU97_009109 [Phlyctochytrium planicorne]